MKKALLIGIDYINNPKASLRGCINDIITTRNMLIDAYDYESENITILRDDFGDFLQPTRTNILTELNWLATNSENLEEIWFHYSGHGSQLQSQNFEMKDIIVPVNYEEEGCIYDSELLDIIRKIKCRIIMVFDCCHSGSICDMPWSFEYTDTNAEKYSRIQINNIVLENQNVYVLSSCRDNESSADSSNNLDQAVGAFSNAFVECLRKSHHNINILELYVNICEFLIENGYTQNPLFSTSNMKPNFVINKNSCK
jgi:hypothetical protein